MSRVKLTEYRAKKVILGDAYRGVAVREGEKTKLPKAGKWVAKVDQGVKKRMKRGLLAVGVDAAKAERAFAAWRKKGYSQFLFEPLFPHAPEEEQYLSLERVRDGIRVLHAREGGIEIEENPEAVKTYLISLPDDIAKVAKGTGLTELFLKNLLAQFDDNFFAFLELNPLVVRGDIAIPLDAAVLVDSAGAFFTQGWGDGDLVKGKAQHATEEAVERLAATTPAQLTLKVLNKDGALFFLFSGGGGSIVIADEAQLQGAGKQIGNYGEYSGGPTREETHLYAREILKLMLASKSKKKALVIAGGVANFTDIKKTFAGIIDALGENAEKMRKQKIKVFVRRGGPNEKAGLKLMEEFLTKEKLLGSIDGSNIVITRAVENAIKYVK
jgi:ATP-citrate lyase beta-subunit